MNSVSLKPHSAPASACLSHRPFLSSPSSSVGKILTALSLRMKRASSSTSSTRAWKSQSSRVGSGQHLQLRPQPRACMSTCQAAQACLFIPQHFRSCLHPRPGWTLGKREGKLGAAYEWPAANTGLWRWEVSGHQGLWLTRPPAAREAQPGSSKGLSHLPLCSTAWRHRPLTASTLSPAPWTSLRRNSRGLILKGQPFARASPPALSPPQPCAWACLPPVSSKDPYLFCSISG